MHDNAIAFFERTAGETRDPPLFHQCWYPVALAPEVNATRPLGLDFLGTRIVVYRDGAGKAVVQEAWCPHLGADLSLGQCIEGTIRCPYHHWRFAGDGVCIDIPAGDKIPPGAKIFTFPTQEAWGLVWAFNGDVPLYDLPTIPGVREDELLIATYARALRTTPPWLSASNGVDFQHLRTLHNLQTGAPDTIDVRDHQIEYCIDTSAYLQHGEIFGTNVFAQHLRIEAMHHYMLFAGMPLDAGRTAGFYVVGVRKPEPEFYRRACALLAIEPAEAVFLDDLGVNLKPARAMGMQTIKVESAAQAIAALEGVLGHPL